MSHSYYLRCPHCGVNDEHGHYNNVALARAAENAYPIWLASKAGWHVRDADYEGLWGQSSIARFLVDHFEHGGFEVVSEYWSDTPEVAARYPPVAVTPQMPDTTFYEPHAIAHLCARAHTIRDELARLMVQMDRRQDEGSP